MAALKNMITQQRWNKLIFALSPLGFKTKRRQSKNKLILLEAEEAVVALAFLTLKKRPVKKGYFSKLLLSLIITLMGFMTMVLEQTRKSHLAVRMRLGKLHLLQPKLTTRLLL